MKWYFFVGTNWFLEVNIHSRYQILIVIQFRLQSHHYPSFRYECLIFHNILLDIMTDYQIHNLTKAKFHSIVIKKLKNWFDLHNEIFKPGYHIFSFLADSAQFYADMVGSPFHLNLDGSELRWSHSSLATIQLQFLRYKFRPGRRQLFFTNLDH